MTSIIPDLPPHSFFTVTEDFFERWGKRMSLEELIKRIFGEKTEISINISDDERDELIKRIFGEEKDIEIMVSDNEVETSYLVMRISDEKRLVIEIEKAIRLKI